MHTIQQLFDLKGQTALITGGSRGLGLQIAEALGEQGARIVLSARKADELQAAQAHLQARGIEADWIAADGARDDEIARLADESLARLGHIDILVNNAGATWGAPAEDHPVEAWDKVMNLNIRGLFLLTQRVGQAVDDPAPPWPRDQRGVHRRAGRQPAGQHGDDCLQHLQGRRGQLHAHAGGRVGEHNITVNALAPGFFRRR